MKLLAIDGLVVGASEAVQVIPLSPVVRLDIVAVGAARFAVVKPLTASVNTKVTVAMSPNWRAVSLMVMLETREGAWVSKVRVGVLPAPPLLPTASL